MKSYFYKVLHVHVFNNNFVIQFRLKKKFIGNFYPFFVEITKSMFEYWNNTPIQVKLINERFGWWGWGSIMYILEMYVLSTLQYTVWIGFTCNFGIAKGSLHMDNKSFPHLSTFFLYNMRLSCLVFVYIFKLAIVRFFYVYFFFYLWFFDWIWYGMDGREHHLSFAARQIWVCFICKQHSSVKKKH